MAGGGPSSIAGAAAAGHGHDSELVQVAMDGQQGIVDIMTKGSELVIKDVMDRPKSSSCVYDRIRPASIPKIRVVMDVGDETEEFSLRMPAALLHRIPLLREYYDFLEGGGNGESGTLRYPAVLNVGVASRGGVPCGRKTAQVRLPGSMWDLLTILRLVVEDEWDGDSLLLDKDDPCVLSRALQARSGLLRSLCMPNSIVTAQKTCNAVASFRSLIFTELFHMVSFHPPTSVERQVRARGTSLLARCGSRAVDPRNSLFPFPLLPPGVKQALHISLKCMRGWRSCDLFNGTGYPVSKLR